jgi:hypothetical protein
MPMVLTSLQRSVHAVLLGKLAWPDWITHGVPKTSKIYTSTLKLPNEINNLGLNGRSFISDGKYLYLHTNCGLFKIGNGHGGTIWGHIYAHKPDFYPLETGWIGYANVCHDCVTLLIAKLKYQLKRLMQKCIFFIIEFLIF